jgi:WD40 repeat protein
MFCCRGSETTVGGGSLSRWLLAWGLLLAAAAVAGRAETPDNPAVVRLVEKLGSTVFQEREEATKRLDALGESALPLLRRAVASEDLEVRLRARNLLGDIQRRLYGQRLALVGHRDVVVSIALSSDGTRVLTGSNDGSIRLWDLASGKMIRAMKGHRGQAWAVALSPDGELALGGGQDGGLALYKVATGEQVRSFDHHPQAVRAAVFTPDGKRALSACYDNVLRLWDVKTGKKLRSFSGHSDSVMCVACSPDGRRALTGGLVGDRSVRVWDLETGKQIRKLTGHGERVMSVAFSPDGRRAVSGSWDGTVRLWDLDTGTELRRFPDRQTLLYGVSTSPSHIYGVAFSPDGKHVASGDERGGLFLWDSATGKRLLSYEGHTAYISDIAFSRQSGLLLSCGGDNLVRVWSVPK